MEKPNSIKPLPKRKEFWGEHIKKLREGIVLLSEDPEEQIDIQHAADAILIAEMQNRFMLLFERPELETDDEFYSTFIDTYLPVVSDLEIKVWMI